MENVDRLEQFWHDFVRIFPDTVELEGAIVAHWLQIPATVFNHVTNVKVTEDKAEVFVKTVISHFESKGLPFACFRVSPLAVPSFISLLERNGFEKESEQSIMVFKGKASEKILNPNVTVKEIKEDGIDVFDRLVVKGFEMPAEWKEVFDRFVVDWMRNGARNYLAYVDGRAVGTISLFSINKTGCILNVSTLKEYRRRGIGTELTTHAIRDSFKEGNDLHTLQTDRGGDAERLYQKLGFKVDHTVSFFVKKL